MQQTGLKKNFILKAAKLLEEIGLPKKLITAELVRHLRFASRRLIYKTLTPEYTRDYNYYSSPSSTSNNDDE
jgi:hypothetical protein